MRGSINWQVQEIFRQSGINQIGESKHAAKEEARLQGAGTWHDVGKRIGIHSYSTADAYRDVWRQVGKYIKTEFKVRNLERLEAKHVQGFLESKIADRVAHATFMQYAAACEKLESALNGFANNKGTGNMYVFSDKINLARKDAHVILERFEGSRAYESPDRLIENTGDNLYRLAGLVQLEGGARVSEVNHLAERDLRGIVKDPVTGKDVGCIRIEKGKGGKSRDVYVKPETYKILLKTIKASENNRFEFNKDNYRLDLEKAAKKSGQDYNGSHGLRWNFAQKRFSEVQRCGISYEGALVKVSNEMGHERADITEHYLR